MAYTQASYAAGAGYYPRHNPGQGIQNPGFKTSVKKHKCNFCDYQSDRTNNVKRHVEKVHPEMYGGHIKPGGGSMENTQQPSRLYPSGYNERNIHGMISEQNKTGGVMVENTQQPPRFYQSNHIENHPEMVNKQSKFAGGSLQNISQPVRYMYSER